MYNFFQLKMCIASDIQDRVWWWFFSETSELISDICCDRLEEMNVLCGKPDTACLKLSLKYKPEVFVGFFFFFFFQLASFQNSNTHDVWRGFLTKISRWGLMSSG